MGVTPLHGYLRLTYLEARVTDVEGTRPASTEKPLREGGGGRRAETRPAAPGLEPQGPRRRPFVTHAPPGIAAAGWAGGWGTRRFLKAHGRASVRPRDPRERRGRAKAHCRRPSSKAKPVPLTALSPGPGRLGFIEPSFSHTDLRRIFIPNFLLFCLLSEQPLYRL